MGPVVVITTWDVTTGLGGQTVSTVIVVGCPLVPVVVIMILEVMSETGMRVVLVKGPTVVLPGGQVGQGVVITVPEGGITGIVVAFLCKGFGQLGQGGITVVVEGGISEVEFLLGVGFGFGGQVGQGLTSVVVWGSGVVKGGTGVVVVFLLGLISVVVAFLVGIVIGITVVLVDFWVIVVVVVFSGGGGLGLQDLEVNSSNSGWG